MAQEIAARLGLAQHRLDARPKEGDGEGGRRVPIALAIAPITATLDDTSNAVGFTSSTHLSLSINIVILT